MMNKKARRQKNAVGWIEVQNPTLPAVDLNNFCALRVLCGSIFRELILSENNG
jgi:hypothetical protein